MDNKIKNALDDINMIKEVMNKTQQNLSSFSGFMISVGGIYLFYIVLEQITYYLRNVYGYSSSIYRTMSHILPLTLLFGYIAIWVIFHIKQKNNDTLNNKLVNIWGIILIGSNIFYWFYWIMLPIGNNSIINMLVRVAQLILFLPVVVGGIVTAVMLKDTIILIFDIGFAIAYIFLFVGMKEIVYGTIGGIGTRIPLNSICLKIFLSIGFLLMGIYLKKWRKVHGNTVNTRSISD